MNIAFFCDAYKPTRNGVAVSAATTANELRARGHRVVIFAPRYTGHEDHDEEIFRFPAGHWFRAKDFPVTWPALSWPVIESLHFSARRRFAREDFDVVHAHSPFTIGTLGAYWARRAHIPLVFTFHTLYHHYLHYAPLPRWFSRFYTLWRVRHYCRLCDHIIAPSQPVARLVRRFRPGAPCTVLATGIQVERFSGGDRNGVRTRYGIAADEIVLLYAGRLVLEKNLIFLLCTLAPLLARCSGQKVRLMLVGGGPALSSLQALARELNIAEQVIFTDFVDWATIPEYYAAGDIFVFASRTETQGVSIAEALAAGLPCVVVGAMGAAESIDHGDNGFIVPPREAEFRTAVARLIEDCSLRRAMSDSARRSAPALSLQSRVDSLLGIYQSLNPSRMLSLAT